MGLIAMLLRNIILEKFQWHIIYLQEMYNKYDVNFILRSLLIKLTNISLQF